MSTPSTPPSTDLFHKHEDALSTVSKSVSKGEKRRTNYKEAKKVTPESNEAQKRLKKNETEKLRYNMLPAAKKKRISMKVAKKADKRSASLDPEKVKSKTDRRNAQQRSRRKLTKIAKAHNELYPHDNIAETNNERPSVTLFGQITKHYHYIPERVKTMGQDIRFEHNGSGDTDGGHFVETRDSGFLQVMHEMHRVLFKDPRNKKIATLDLGSGLGYPSQIFGQYMFEHGFHVGIELGGSLAAGAWGNLKAMTLKGLYNIQKGYFSKAHVLENGELNHTVPPRMWLVHGDIERITHLGGFDALYQFDIVNSPETKLAVAKLWNMNESRHCKVIVSNSNEREMREYGFDNIDLRGQATINFRTSGSESRTAYVYARTHLRSDRLKYSLDMEDVDVCPLFEEGFKLLREGDKQAEILYTGFKVNSLLIDANVERDCLAHLPKPPDRSNRRPIRGTYNEDDMIEKEWAKAESEAYGRRVANVPSHVSTYRSDGSTEPSILTIDLTLDSDSDN